MPGTIHGKIGSTFTGTIYARWQHQLWFAHAYKALKFFATKTNSAGNPLCIEVARYNGYLSTTGDASTGYATPSINAWTSERDTRFCVGAWATFKFPVSNTRSEPFYVHICWWHSVREDSISQSSNNPANPTYPCLFNNDGIDTLDDDGAFGASFAVPIGGDNDQTFDVWNGPTGSLGSDTKGDPVWSTGSLATQILTFPRSNDVSGSHETQKHNLMSSQRALDDGTLIGDCYYNTICDDDNIMFMHRQPGQMSNGGWHFLYFGKYIPRPGLTISYPYVAIGTENNIANIWETAAAYGSVLGNNNEQGGIATPDHDLRVVRTQVSCVNELSGRYEANPSVYRATPGQYDVGKVILLMQDDYNPGVTPGRAYAGHLDTRWAGFVSNVPSYIHGSDGQSLIVSTEALASSNKSLIAWPAGAPNPFQVRSNEGELY